MLEAQNKSFYLLLGLTWGSPVKVIETWQLWSKRFNANKYDLSRDDFNSSYVGTKSLEILAALVVKGFDFPDMPNRDSIRGLWEKLPKTYRSSLESLFALNSDSDALIALRASSLGVMLLSDSPASA